MTLIDVGKSEDLGDGVLHVVVAGGREIGIVHWNGRWYAVRNACPHLGGPLCAGVLVPTLSAGESSKAINRIVADQGHPMIVCPWHRWEFDLTTGCSVSGQQRVRTYRVVQMDGRVFVDTGGRPRGGTEL